MYFFPLWPAEIWEFFLNKQLLDLYVQGNATGITLKFDSIGAAYHNIRYLKWDAKK